LQVFFGRPVTGSIKLRGGPSVGSTVERDEKDMLDPDFDSSR
jgi:hypothetical protein